MGVKLGTDNNWAIKDGNLLAYNDASGRFFNKEFDFARGSRATYVGRDGLIKNSGEQPTNLVQNGDFSQLGSELVVNGDFATDSNWTKGTGWSISGGSANYNTSSNNTLSQEGSFVDGKTYKVTLEVKSYVRGTPFVSISSGASVQVPTSVGVHTMYIVAGTNASKVFRYYGGGFGSGGEGTIDNVSIKQVDPNDEWSLAGWVIGNGQASNSGSGAGNNLYQGGVTSVGKTFKVVIDTTISAGSVLVMIGGGTGGYNVIGEATTSGTFTYSGVSNGTNNNILLQTGSGTTIGSVAVDNVSVQEIDTNTPRIDFTDDVNGHLLLEPQRTNLITYSEDFSNAAWTKSGASITRNAAISPDGTQTADLITNISSNGYAAYTASFDANLEYTFSVFVKAGTSNLFSLVYTPFMSQVISVEFDLSSETATVNAGTPTNFGIDNFGNGWFRIFITEPKNATTGTSFVRVVLSGSTSDTGYIWGAQVEQGSYATSYIPTYGSVQTRLGETCNNSGSAQDFNSEEGVLYAEISALADDLTLRSISLSDGTTNNVATIRYRTNSNRIQVVVFSGGVLQFSNSYDVTNILDFNKVAISYNQSDFNYWVNGVKRVNSTSGNTPIGITELTFDNGAGNDPFYGNIKELQVFTTALSDAELTALTTI